MGREKPKVAINCALRRPSRERENEASNRDRRNQRRARIKKKFFFGALALMLGARELH